MVMAWYFAYGSNLDMDRLRERIGEWQDDRRATLKGYRLSFDSRGKADIFEQRGERVWGAVYKVSEAQLKILDRFEGLHSGVYKRVRVNVECNGKTEPAITYVKVEKTSFHPPDDEYLNHILKGLKQHGYDEETIEMVRAIARQKA